MARTTSRSSSAAVKTTTRVGSVSKLTSSRTASHPYPACAGQGEEYRLELGEELDALRAVLGFPDDGDIFVGIEKLP